MHEKVTCTCTDHSRLWHDAEGHVREFLTELTCHKCDKKIELIVPEDCKKCRFYDSV